MNPDGQYRCVSAFRHKALDGLTVRVPVGAVVWGDDDRFRGHEEHFVPVGSSSVGAVEVATAVPGQSRIRTIPLDR